MYIIAIGWMYVVVLMAFSETGLVAGLATFIFYGLLPVSLILWLGGAKARRQQRRISTAQTSELPQPCASSQMKLPMRPVSPSRRKEKKRASSSKVHPPPP